MLMSSLPLSLTAIFGLPRSIISRSSSRATDARERGVGYQRQALAGAVVDHGEDTEAATIGEQLMSAIANILKGNRTLTLSLSPIVDIR